MHHGMLEWLQCPFCGTRATIVDSSPTVERDGQIESGVIGCECCAYPVVDGIPVLVADETTRAAMHQLEAGDSSGALESLLGLEGERAEAFRALRRRPEDLTYRAAIGVLSPDPEGTYFLYRFSDPTYVMAQSLIQAIEDHPRLRTGRAIDLCGGSGHLTRVLAGSSTRTDVVLADVYYWKLWLAKEFTAPRCSPVCCDANNPLPFSAETFQLAVLSDAFPYIWHKRLLADEMVRLVGRDGTVVMPHLHSSLGENFSAGMTLTPASYRDLFSGLAPRLFADSALLDDILGHGQVDLSAAVTAEGLGSAPSFTLVASHDESLFRRFSVPAPSLGVGAGELRVNPLYVVEADNNGSVLTLRFPNDDYEAEFGDCKRYLPAKVRLPGDARGPLDRTTLGPTSEHFLRSRVLLDVPLRYC